MERNTKAVSTCLSWFSSTMSLSLQESFDRSCRLCAEVQDVTIMIFSAEAEAMLLQNKLNKYLLIEVDETDRLPKNICLKCCSKLQIVCDFIDKARIAQDQLHDRSILLDQITGDFTTTTTTIQPYDDQIKNEPMNFTDADENFTEMEVSVDPMMILENYEAGDENHTEDNNARVDFDDVSYLHGLDGENVTIKLIRKGDNQSDPMELLEESNEGKRDPLKPFPCVECCRSFCTELALKNHMWMHSTDDKKQSKKFKCHSCERSFDVRADLITHLKEHKVTSTCQDCGRSSSPGCSSCVWPCRESNEGKRDPLKPFTCVECCRSFCTELALKNHMWMHPTDKRPSKKFECRSCDRGFDVRADFITHLKEHKITSTCQECGRSFRSKENLWKHMESHRSPQNAHVCTVCGRTYNSISNLKTHSVTHSAERPFGCHLCKKSFKRNQDLKFHINQHTGAKPYKCPFCDKSFASSGNCYSHRSRMHPDRRLESKRTRTQRRRRGDPSPSLRIPQPVQVKGVYKFQCLLCHHSFVKRDNYTYHMFQHTGEKPFHCSLCTEKFVTKRGLLLHYEKAHKGRERPLALISKNALLK